MMTTLAVKDVIDLLVTLSNEENLRVAVCESFKACLITGAATFVGGLLSGPRGIAIGAALGGLSAAALSYKKFESVGSVLQNMDDKQKEELYQRTVRILSSVSSEDIHNVHAVITNSEARNSVIATIIDFVHGELKMEIID